MAKTAGADDYSLEPYSLKGQNAVVTGAASGIGRATAKLFAAVGAKVIVSDMNGEGCQSVVAEIEAAGGQALAAPCDVSDEGQVEAMFERADGWFGAPDVLACVAAYRKKHFTMSMSVAEWDVMHAVIARGTYLCIRQAAQRMKASGRGGSIVNVSSVSAVRPTIVDSMDYDSAKAGVNAITRAAALEFIGDGIRVNAIMPGGTKRPGAPPLSDKGSAGPFTQPGRLPLGPADAIEQARVILFLASPASSYVSGICMAVDGAAMLT
jgi:NAD(P)-dependent dehydrogenase (short-subunit alcohol dehydrogenase family)